MSAEILLSKSSMDKLEGVYQNSDETMKITLFVLKNNGCNKSLVYLKTMYFESHETYIKYLEALKRYNFHPLVLENNVNYNYYENRVVPTYTIIKNPKTDEDVLSFIFIQNIDGNYEAIYFNKTVIQDRQKEELFLKNMEFIPYAVASNILLNRNKNLIK